MALAVSQLKQWHLPVNPINYAVSYEYCQNKKSKLIASIKRFLLSGRALDNFFMEQLYKEHLLEQSKFREEILSDLSSLLTQFQQRCQQSVSGAEDLIEQFDDYLPELMSGDKEKVKLALSKLHQASTTFKMRQHELATNLEQAQMQTKALEDELEQVREELYLDPVTGLHNRKAMSKHVDVWLGDETNKSIVAIVVSVDHFSQFKERFGSLIGDVILSKIAKKVASYVDDSGLPVRSACDEFIVLLPDVEAEIANEIAEKIKQGVEKLRFVSVQSGVRLPKMSVSCGVGEMKNKEPLNKFINRSRNAIISG